MSHRPQRVTVPYRIESLIMHGELIAVLRVKLLQVLGKINP